MDFSHSDKVRDLQEAVTRFMQRAVYPAEAQFQDEVLANRRQGNAWRPTAIVEELKRKPRRRAVESISAGFQIRCRAHEPRVCAALRNHGDAPRSGRKHSTAPRPIRETWKCWCAMDRMSSASAG